MSVALGGFLAAAAMRPQQPAHVPVPAPTPAPAPVTVPATAPAPVPVPATALASMPAPVPAPATASATTLVQASEVSSPITPLALPRHPAVSSDLTSNTGASAVVGVPSQAAPPERRSTRDAVDLPSSKLADEARPPPNARALPSVTETRCARATPVVVQPAPVRPIASAESSAAKVALSTRLQMTESGGDTTSGQQRQQQLPPPTAGGPSLPAPLGTHLGVGGVWVLRSGPSSQAPILHGPSLPAVSPPLPPMPYKPSSDSDGLALSTTNRRPTALSALHRSVRVVQVPIDGPPYEEDAGPHGEWPPAAAGQQRRNPDAGLEFEQAAVGGVWVIHGAGASANAHFGGSNERGESARGGKWTLAASSRSDSDAAECPGAPSTSSPSPPPPGWTRLISSIF